MLVKMMKENDKQSQCILGQVLERRHSRMQAITEY